MNYWHQVTFQEASSVTMSGIKSYHDHVLMIIIPIVVLVFYCLIQLKTWNYISLFYKTNHILETVWTIFPALLLLVLAIPRMKLLYTIEEVYEPFLTLKTIAHQWYWSYEYSDFTDLEFDAYIVGVHDLNVAESRVIERDHRVVLPLNEIIRVLITRDDVIHSWSIPAIGVKCDAIPGRLNQLQFTPTYAGQFYGQCSEICGTNHSFMPICLEVVPFKSFVQWI